MKITQLSVEFKKTVNDGNYGNESAHCQLSAEVDDHDDMAALTTLLQMTARDHVLDQLRRSNNITVRRNANPRLRLCAECNQELGDYDNGYHEACLDIVRTRREEERRVRQSEDQGTTAADDEFAKDAVSDDGF